MSPRRGRRRAPVGHYPQVVFQIIAIMVAVAVVWAASGAVALPPRAPDPPAGVDAREVPLPPSQRTATPRVPGRSDANSRPLPTRIRELAEQRTANARVFALSDGRFETELSTERRSFRDGHGRWRDVDTTVRPVSRDGFRFGNDSNAFGSLFGDRSDRLVQLEAAGKQVTLGLDRPARTVAPVPDKSTVTYAGAFDDADLVYQVTSEALKEQIVLSKPPQDPTYRFTLQLGGVTARAQPDGSIGFFPSGTGADGPPVFAMPKPFMMDGRDDAKSPHGKAWSDKVTQSVEQRGPRITVTVRADRAWLASPDRRYPVVIDPTIKIEPTPTTGQDVQIWSDTPTRPDGLLYRLSVGTDGTDVARSLIKFDTSVVPGGTSLSSARLRVYFDSEIPSPAQVDNTIEARRVTAAWSEDTATWSTINSAFAEAGLSTQVKQVNRANIWHEFDIRNIAQSWVSGSAQNFGVMLKATNEALSRSGPIYQAAEFAYNGEVENRPKLILTYGRPGADLKYPTRIYSTGAELNWTPAPDPDPTNPNDDVVEYQVHRTVFQTFTPSAATLVAPLPPTATSFTDTTARPTPADSPDPFGNAYYYMVVAKSRDGQLIPGPTQVARLPKAGLVTQMFHGGTADATLSATRPDTNLDTLGGQPWVMVGNNSATYGRTRAVVKFTGLSAIPTNARIIDADFQLWAFFASPSSVAGATFDAHALTRPFVASQTTWNRASTATAWTTPGGDIGPALDNVVGITNDPKWQIWENASVVQGWVSNPATNDGYLVKLRDEAGAAQRVVFLSNEAAEPQLRPNLVVTYTQPTAEQTYYAPDTPSGKMVSGDTYTVPVTVTNTTGTTWSAADQVLSYRLALPDGTDVTGGNRLETPLPANVPPNGTVTVQAQVKTTLQNTEGNKREQQVVSWDLRNRTNGTWLSATGGPPALPQNVSVEDPTSDELGLEKFYSYSGTSTGAGSNVLVNHHAGNTVFSYDAFSHPGRGLSTFVRLTYNSLDTTATASGYGWSLAASGLVRLGSHLRLHPPGQDYPTQVTLPDGDGTSHVFLLNNNSSDPAQWFYEHPHGVHLYLQRNGGSDTSRRWKMTRPDRTEFVFDDEGWLTAVRDRNGNEQRFTYTQRKSNNQPRKFLTYVDDPTGRQTLSLDYWERGETSNPHIIDQVQSVRDVSGRTLTFAYSDMGLLTDLVDGAGSAQPKAFHFDYDATQGNKNVKLVKITDPLGSATNLAYFTAPVDPKNKWKLQTITDRRGFATDFTYTDPDGPQGSEMDATLTDAENHVTRFHMDGFGRPVTTINARDQITTLGWDGDHNVTSLTEDNHAVTIWTYDTRTGYPTSIRDAEAVAHNWPATTLGYQTSLGGYVADLTSKTSPEGRRWEFAYDARGNLTLVTDPKGVVTPGVPDDYQSTYTYDEFGQPQNAVDANGNTTRFRDYDPTGYPTTVIDALDKTTSIVYDSVGNLTKVIDPRKNATPDPNDYTARYTYDTFGRLLETTVPKDQAAGDLIVTPAPVYDANDNVTQATAPNGAVSTAVYDRADQATSVTLPKDTADGPARTTTLTYDKVGNLLTETEPMGNLTPDPGDYKTSYGYDEIYQLTAATDAAEHRISYSYDNVGNLTKVVDPRKNATADPDDYTTTYTYDRNHRRLTVTDALGHIAGTGYDRDGNVTSTTDKENNTTTYVYDERAKLSEVRVPHKLNGAPRITRLEYDEVGNKTRTVSPRGVDTTDDPDDFATTIVYDQLNRPIEQHAPFDRDDPHIRTTDKTFYGYDPSGNLTTVDAPPSAGQTVRNVTRNTYLDNGWVRTSTDPWDIVTSYDYNPLGKQTTRTVTSAGGSSSRTMTWDYYPDGKLKSRSDNGVPVGSHVALVDNSDVANTETAGTWATATAGAGFTGYDYRSAPAGTGAAKFTWKPIIPQDGTYEVFVRYPSGTTGAATAAQFTVDTGTAQTVRTVNQTQNAGQWVSLGRYDLAAGNAAKVWVSDQASGGTVLADAVKLVRDNSGDTDTERKTFGHAYDANGNLTALTDTSPGAAVDAYAMTYDGINQLTKVEEKLGTAVKNTTGYTYNENGNPTTRTHDSQSAVYRYDVRDLVDQATITEPGQAAKVTEFSHWPRGQLRQERKANQNTVDYTYTLDGLEASQIEKKADGTTLVSQHVIDYDANSHRVRDASKIQNADNAAAYLDEIREYVYDPRDRIRRVIKKAAGSGAVLETEDYSHDANNNVIAQTLEGRTTTFAYDRNRLVTATTSGVTASYNYDPFGRLDTITSGGQIIESYTYDGFDRTREHRKREGSSLTTTAYVYDPLDRTSSKTEQAGTPSAKTTNFAYLGLTDKVLTERIAGQIQRTYQYDALGQRLSQVKKDTDGSGPGVEETSFYGYSPHTDVETLTKENGDTRATYGYTAYGKDDNEAFTGIDKPEAQNPGKEPYNFYRYTGKRWDPASSSYDMGFRDYNPGLNRFLTRDTYNGALADLNLGTNPWTGNRYAFTGGNPISRIEIDGHWCDGCNDGQGWETEHGDLQDLSIEDDTNLCAVDGCTDSNGNVIVGDRWLKPSMTPEYISSVKQYASEAGIDPQLLLAVLITESGDCHCDEPGRKPDGAYLGLAPMLGGQSVGLANMRAGPFQLAKGQSKGAIDFPLSATYGLENRENVLRSAKAAAYYLAHLKAKLGREHKLINPYITQAELLRIGYNMPTGEGGSRNFMGELASKYGQPEGDPARIIGDFRQAWNVSGRLLELASLAN
jgi:RHS repeat-associated protein